MAQSGSAQQQAQFLLLRNSLCAGTAAATAAGIFNPLDTLRVRWQLSPAAARAGGEAAAASPAGKAASTSLFRFAGSIMMAEGLVAGLWRPGVVATMLSIGGSCGIRMGSYPYLRDWVLGDAKHKTPLAMFSTGLVAGGVGYWVACPVFQAKTRLQAATVMRYMEGTGSSSAQVQPNASSMINQLRTIWQEGGAPGLFRGAGPLVLRGALFSAGQTLGYDGTKTTLAQKHQILPDGPALHVLGSVVAAFLATVFSAPADFVMVRYQSASQMGVTYSGPLDCLRTVVKEEGPAVLYRGWTPYFMRIVPVFITFHPLFEQLRVLAGLSYMT